MRGGGAKTVDLCGRVGTHPNKKICKISKSDSKKFRKVTLRNFENSSQKLIAVQIFENDSQKLIAVQIFEKLPTLLIDNGSQK